MSAWAKPGAKVVCINAYHPFNPMGLVEGRIYEIASVRGDHTGLDHNGVVTTGAAISLVGVVKPPPMNMTNFYDIDRFRPLITRTQEQDLALFTPILDGLRVGEDA